MKRKTTIMGIVNLTDNSFFSESRHFGPEAIDAVLRMFEDGADIVDIGACSSRPGSFPVSPEEEWRRLDPVLRGLEGKPLSIDTFHAEVVRKAYDLHGPFIVNDISSGEDDPDMLPSVGRLGLRYIAMHKRGTPATMSSLTDYPGGVTSCVKAYFEDFSIKAGCLGIKDWILDPGFGFAKTVEQNWELLSNLHKLESLGRPILAGLSRKSMIWKPLGISPEEALPGTQIANFEALRQGASILRVHDVKEAAQTARLFALWEEESGTDGPEC